MPNNDYLDDILRQRELSKKRARNAAAKAKKERENALKLDEELTNKKTIANDFLSIYFQCDNEEEQARMLKAIKKFKKAEKEDKAEDLSNIIDTLNFSSADRTEDENPTQEIVNKAENTGGF